MNRYGPLVESTIVLLTVHQRGGAHLGYIVVTGAHRIEQQQCAGTSKSVGKDNEYMHAFSIIGVKRGQSKPTDIQQVLCAESNEECDSWVEALVQCAQLLLPNHSSHFYSF